jgi:tRNA-guanine family transglycosylase
MHRVLEWTCPLLPEDRPRHLLGIGEPDDLFEAVARGIDTFDCVAPTRLARNGALLVSPEAGGRRENRFRLSILRSAWAADDSPPDPHCSCYTCRHFSRAYLRHLFKEEELLAYRLASLHNVHFVCRLMEEVRESILSGSFPELRRKWLGDSPS